MSTSDKTPRAPQVSVKLPAKSAGFQRSSFVNRYKLQQQRIRTLNQLENSSESKKRAQKALPKIDSGPDKENLVIRAVQRSNTIDIIKLPGVKGQPQPQPAIVQPKRKSLPVKTYHLRVNPDHASFISKSLPSLPSIPGSPSYPVEQAVSPLTEREADKGKAVPIYASKHRFEKIVFQKHIHGDSDPAQIASASSGPRQHPLAKGSHSDRALPLPPGLLSARSLDKPHTSGSVRIRYSKAPSEVVISETQSEPSFEVNRKWKDNCRCLRCQMLKRQFREGDSHYALWGRYPCHNVDPSVMLDD